MKTLVKGILLTAGLALAVSSLPAAQSGDDRLEQYFKAKLGRNSPAEDARLRAERATTAFREETPLKVTVPNWNEQHVKGKLGRYSRAEEARLREVGTAFREETPTGVAPTYLEQYMKGKLGRSAER